MPMHTYQIAVEPKGKMEENRYVKAYTAADALVQLKVFCDWQFDGAYRFTWMETLPDPEESVKTRKS